MHHAAVVSVLLVGHPAVGHPTSPSEVARLVGTAFVANGSTFLNWEAGFTCRVARVTARVATTVPPLPRRGAAAGTALFCRAGLANSRPVLRPFGGTSAAADGPAVVADGLNDAFAAVGPSLALKWASVLDHYLDNYLKPSDADGKGPVMDCTYYVSVYKDRATK